MRLQQASSSPLPVSTPAPRAEAAPRPQASERGATTAVDTWELPRALEPRTSRLLDALAEGGRVTAREAGFFLALYRTLSFDALVGDIEPQVRKILARTELDEMVVFTRSRDVQVALDPQQIEAMLRARLMTKVTAGILRKAPSGAMISSGGLLALGLLIPEFQIGFLAGCVAMLGIGLGATPIWLVKHRRLLREEMDRVFARPEIKALIEQKRAHLSAVVDANAGNVEAALRAGLAERVMRAFQASALITRVGGVTKYAVAAVAGVAIMAASAFSFVSGMVYSALKKRLRGKSLRDPAMLLAHALVESTEKRALFAFGRTPFTKFVKARKAELRALLGLPGDAKTRHILKTLKYPEYAGLREQLQAECRRELLRQALDHFAAESGSSLQAVLHDDAALGRLITDYAVVTAARIAGNTVLSEGMIQSLKGGSFIASAAFIAGPAAPFVAAAGAGAFVLGALITFMFSRRERAQVFETLTRAVQGRGVPLPSQIEPGSDEAALIEATIAREIQLVVETKMADVRRAPEPLRLPLPAISEIPSTSTIRPEPPASAEGSQRSPRPSVRVEAVEDATVERAPARPASPRTLERATARPVTLRTLEPRLGLGIGRSAQRPAEITPAAEPLES